MMRFGILLFLRHYITVWARNRFIEMNALNVEGSGW